MLTINVRKGLIVLVGLVSLIAVELVISSTATAEGRTLIMNVNREGTAGYAVGNTIAQLISKHSDLKVSGIPYSSPVAGFRDSVEGKCDIPYGAGLDLWQANNGKGPYADNPLNAKTYQGFYYTEGDLFWVTRADRDDINHLADIAGKKVFPAKLGSGISEGLMYMLKVLDIEMGQNVQMGYMEAANALKRGLIDVAGVYVVSRGKIAPSWTQNIASQLEIKIIEPTEAEARKLKEGLARYGIGYERLPVWFKKDVGVKEKTTMYAQVAWGWHFAPSVTTNEAYTFMKTYSSPAVLEGFSKSHALLKDNSDINVIKEKQINYINTVKQEPIHPGVAKWLKEIGIWQDDWKEAR